MRNIKLLIEYDGGNYAGWQRQDDQPSIQEELNNAIYKVTKEKIDIIGSGRTDKGVHALGQVANFYTETSIPGERFKYSLNPKLPDDIQILESEEVEESFHSRFDACMKKYKYIVYNNPQPRPMYRNFSCHVRKKLNVEDMKKASKYFIGTHDFKAFMARKSIVDTTVRTIYDIKIEKEQDFIIITFLGKSFLRHMVRIISGTLIKIGQGKLMVEDAKKIIESRDRRKAAKTAPPQGLFLEKVYYEVEQKNYYL